MGPASGSPRVEERFAFSVRSPRTIRRGTATSQRMIGYTHYRTVEPEFYIPPEMFKDSKNLTQIMYDIILGG